MLLVEGPSEKILFERIMKEKFERYESHGGYILQVDGISFSEYYKVLTHLGIKVIVKTDNDLKLNKKNKECNLLGLNRGLELAGIASKPNIPGIDVVKYKKNTEYKKTIQKKVFEVSHKKDFKSLRAKSIHISKIDLENDLYEVIPLVMDKLAKDNNSSKSAIDYLQSAKLINMIDLCTRLSTRHCNSIYNNDLFYCLKELAESCSQ